MPRALEEVPLLRALGLGRREVDLGAASSSVELSRLVLVGAACTQSSRIEKGTDGKEIM